MNDESHDRWPFNRLYRAHQIISALPWRNAAGEHRNPLDARTHLIVRVLCFALFIANSTAALSDVQISSDSGGRIGDYFRWYKAIRRNGDRVIIDGQCLSACTLVVAIIPRERLCATRNAVLGFHAAEVDEYNARKSSVQASRALFKLYPASVQSWIARRGGLTSRMLLMRGRELDTVVRPCGPGDSAR